MKMTLNPRIATIFTHTPTQSAVIGTRMLAYTFKANFRLKHTGNQHTETVHNSFIIHLLCTNYSYIIATTCFGLTYDHYQVAHDRDKKLKIKTV
jgi:hypothetical protein